MALSQAEIDQIIEKATAACGAAFASKDPSKVAAFYDQHAVLIKSGKTGSQAWFGREDITKGLEPFVKYDFTKGCALCKALVPKPIDGQNFPIALYLIERGAFEFHGDMVEFEVVWKKQAGGSYLIVRDEFKVL